MTTATTDPAESIEQLVDDAIALKGRIALQSAQLKAIEARIIERGAGKHAGTDGRSVTVVGASSGKPGTVSYAWPAGEDQEAIEARIRKLADMHFAKLFSREVIFTPVAGFENIAAAVLTPGRARDLVDLCARVGNPTSGKSAYLIYPK